MKIKVLGNLGHHTYGWMRRKAEHGFRELGHEIVEDGEDMILAFGSCADWSFVKKSKGKKFHSCHGVDWWRGPKSPENERIRGLWKNSDVVAYQSEFAKHMTEKTFNGERGNNFIYNAGIPDFPEELLSWKEGETIHMATCAIFRPWKRLHEMERLTKMLNDKGTKVELHVIGKDGEPSEPYFHYYGVIGHEEMKEIAKKCHFYLHLGFNDYSPAVVGEMMAWGLPAMVTNSGGSKDIVQDNGIILWVDNFIDSPFNIYREDVLPKVDDEKFENGFWEMMNNLEDYQKKNKEWVLEEINATKQAEKWIKLYENI